MIARPMIRASRLCCRCYATGTSTTPPMLLKIRKDMKTAMQSKDTNRLSVLRALLSQTLNASKTSTPINTDMQMLALLRKSANAAKAAAEEFKGAGRQDLADKEDLQRRVLEEYAGEVEVLGESEIRAAVEGVVEGMRGEGEVKLGDVLKRVFEKDVLGEKAVERGEVARIVREVLKVG
ncbi:Yqey-like protein-domain-containing protein [Rhexocercosporidium sp. MPI-PUGE-AT-0058]|nr:Yqey-like protein-domain-containing protein [Rhexocercosporidium sp. MPI-PUGE-AT-0058]